MRRQSSLCLLSLVLAAAASAAQADVTITPDVVYSRFPALDLDMKDAETDSPLVHVTADDAPTLLLAGDKDDLVPIQHSRNIQSAFETAKVTSQLVEFAGAGHGFQGEDAKKATEAMVAWFETHLAAEVAK